MTNTFKTVREVSKTLDAAGITRGFTSTSGRVKGWAGHTSEGYSVQSPVFVFRAVRNGRRVRSYYDGAFQTVSVDYCADSNRGSREDAENGASRVEEAVRAAGFWCERSGSQVSVRVANPYHNNPAYRSDY